MDVPEICNLVFLRRVNSRILFDQMLGRATRRCDEIGKETFRIFDAVRIYEALHDLTAMQPVVVDPAISFTQLVSELVSLTDDVERTLVRDQLLAKLQRKKRHLNEEAAAGLRDPRGHAARCLPAAPQNPAARGHRRLVHPEPGPRRDSRPHGGRPRRADLHLRPPGHAGRHRARLWQRHAPRGLPPARSPTSSAPTAIASQRWSRCSPAPGISHAKQLRELALELDKAGFSEAKLATAWREKTNQEIAARIVGYIRQAAIGDPLVPYAQRVDQALQKMLAARAWTTPQRQWLQKLAAQTKVNLIVDRAALDDPDLIFKREGGGFSRLDRIFGGQLQHVLDAFNDSLWAPAA